MNKRRILYLKSCFSSNNLYNDKFIGEFYLDFKNRSKITYLYNFNRIFSTYSLINEFIYE